MKAIHVVNKDACCLIYAESLPSNPMKSPIFKKALELVGNYGRGYLPPTYNKARVTYLQEAERIDKVYLKNTMSRACKDAG